jgi:hypothetical protein
MELIITLIALIIIWCIAFMVGNKQGTNQLINQIKKDGGYYDMEYTSSAYPILDPTSSLNEVPKELLMGGDIERTLHIAGIKEATPAKLSEWENERRAKVETKTELSMDALLSKLNKTDLQIKAGLIENTDKTGADIKIEVKEIDPIFDNKKIMEAARKESDREREQRIKIDFDALNFSRISNEARKQITEIVRKDIENKMKVVEENSPEINENDTMEFNPPHFKDIPKWSSLNNDTMGTIGSKPKTQTDYQNEHKIPPCVGHEIESQKEIEKGDIDFMHKWIREKSGK